ncbi:hypothetical protein [Streptomyces sp. NPDC058268]
MHNAVENNVLAQLCHGVGEVGEAKPGEDNGARSPLERRGRARDSGAVV